MSYTPQPYSPQPAGYSSTPPAPPPKPSGSSTPSRGPPLPPPPPGQQQNEPSELDGSHTYYNQQQQALAQTSIPSIESNWLPESLKDKSTQDLHHFLSTPALQNAHLSNIATTHPAIPASESHLTPLINSNLALANSTLELEQRLSALRERTQSRLLALRALEQQHRTKITETEDALREFSPMALYQRLNASVQEQDLLVRGVEESWLEDEGVASEREVSEFVRRVKDARKVAFLRRERKGRWDEGRVGGWR